MTLLQQVAIAGYIITCLCILMQRLIPIKMYEIIGSHKIRTPEQQKAWESEIRYKKSVAFGIAFIHGTMVTRALAKAVGWFFK